MQKPKYADPSVIAVNKEDGHAIAMPYDTAAQALAGGEQPIQTEPERALEVQLVPRR